MAQPSAALIAAWTVLGLGPGATRPEITRAYRLRARSIHPDVSSAHDSAARFAELAAAYRQAIDALDDPNTPVEPAPERKRPRSPGRSAYAVVAEPAQTASWHTDGWLLFVGPATVSPITRPRAQVVRR
jgi:curved DNA-binding protein CbpA